MLRNKALKYIPAILIAIGIAILSLWEQPQMPPTVTLHDKIAHGLVYTVWAISMMTAVGREARMRVRTYIYTCVIATAYGALMEILQRFCTLTRSGEMADLYADAIGAIIGVILVALLSIVNRQSSNRQ